MFYYIIIRLIEEDGSYRIYYSTENSKEYQEYELQYLEIDAEFVPGIQKIIISYPNFICVKELPIENDDVKVLSIFTYIYICITFTLYFYLHYICIIKHLFKND